jgi:hypothetical protein
MTASFLSAGVLEEILAAPQPDAEALRALGRPPELAPLFTLLAFRAVRRGPTASALSPAALLAAALQAAIAGALRAEDVLGLRRRLEEAAEAVRRAGAWRPGAPLWWEPLPPPSPLETAAVRWLEREEETAAALRPPAAETLVARFRGAGAPRWLGLPGFLVPELLAAVGGELEAAYVAGSLGLAAEGVGATGRLSAKRSDRVTYLDGLEADLLAAAPTFAALVQVLLAHLAEFLAATGEDGLAAPQKAMLSRYPALSAGYAPHVDNPAGEDDSGRALTFVLYLNAPERPAVGGEIAVWEQGRKVSEEPSAVLPALGGSAVLFDARTIAHQVKPLAAGPARWALTLWLQDGRARPPAFPEMRLTVDDVLLGAAAPPLPAGTTLFHTIDGADPAGQIRVVTAVSGPEPRAGIVATVYGAGDDLAAWCEHHLGLGFAALLLVFDRLEEPEEARLAERLAARFGARLTIWSGTEAAAGRWAELPDSPALAESRERATGGGTSYAVSARQVLNATAALTAARRGELGEGPLDWLLNLDADEWFRLEGAARGGDSVAGHFAAAEAAGYRQLRYAVHELLPPLPSGKRPRFKLNPRLAEARLGKHGWAELVSFLAMAQTDRRPYFQGYFNGKSAVAVRAAREAAGVHGWTLAAGEEGRAAFVAGPSILHFLCPTPEGFARKFRGKAAAPAPGGPLPFPPSPTEEAALAAIRALLENGAGPEALEGRLRELHAELTTFTPAEIGLLDEAGLLFSLDEPGR